MIKIKICLKFQYTQMEAIVLSWYIELLISLALWLALFPLIERVIKSNGKKEVLTKDGYAITLDEYFKKLAIGRSDVRDNLFTSEFALTFLLIPVFLLGYAVVVLLDGLFNIGYLSTLYSFGVMLWVYVTDYKQVKKNIERETRKVSNIRLTVCTDNGGPIKYIPSPLDYEYALSELDTAQHKLKKLHDKLEMSELRLQKEYDLGDLDSAQKEKQKIKFLKEQIISRTHDVIMANKEVELELSDEMPERFAHILSRKQNGEQLIPKTVVPHHIRVLQNIAEDTTLPQEMREEAKETLDNVMSEDLKRQEDERLNDVRVELELAKKLIK